MESMGQVLSSRVHCVHTARKTSLMRSTFLYGLVTVVLVESVVGVRGSGGERQSPACDKHDFNVRRPRKDLIRGTYLALDENENRQAILDGFSTTVPTHKILDPRGDYLVKEFLETGRLVNGMDGSSISGEYLKELVDDESGEVEIPNWKNEGPMNKTIFEKHLDRLIFLTAHPPQATTSAPSKASSMSDEEAKHSIKKAIISSKKLFTRNERLEYLKAVAERLLKENLRYAAKAFEYIRELDPSDIAVGNTLLDVYLDIGEYEAAFNLFEEIREHLSDADSRYRNLVSRLGKRLGKEWGRRVYVEDTSIARTVPRLTKNDLYDPQNVDYLLGNKPFILVGAVEDTDLTMMQRRMEAVLEYFSDKSLVSYAPYGIHIGPEYGPSHVSVSLKRAVRLLEYTKGDVTPNATDYVNTSQRGPHVQWMPNSLEWYPISKFLGLRNISLPSLLHDNASGLSICGGFGDRDEMRSLEEALPTRLITLGAQHSGLFMHDDAVPLSAWQFQLLGAKTWLFCPPSEGKYIGSAQQVDGNAWDPHSQPQFSLARCTNTTVFPGEIVYYPTKYWHQTLYHLNEDDFGDSNSSFTYPWNLTPINVALGSRVVQPQTVERLNDFLEHACESKSGAFFTPDPLFCKRGLSKYIKWLRNRYQGALETDADRCSKDDERTAQEEERKDANYMSLVEKLVRELEETYRLVEQEYQEEGHWRRGN
eukprot:gb/GECG01004365.1/.p1 GENE.gb/GECG01004365.1/~~gb/GECG01004365.1/.p1  ORF type:complete len:707 (+),score=90.76 gb/GECG01004365.1/:1-2121(+)